jgi:hypothetical protein
VTRLRSVNTEGIAGAIRFGCRTMRHIFDADDGDVPFFGSRLRPEAFLRFSPHHSEAHVPGRHLNALLAAEEVAPDDSADAEILDNAVANHRRALMLSYGGVLPLPLNRPEPADIPPVNFCPHNLREGFHGLFALARWGDDGEAAELAEKSIAAIRQLWHPQRGWDKERLRRAGLQYQPCQGFVHGEARMLGPLVKLHEATGSLRALRLAEDLVDKLTAEFYLEDGAYTQDRFGIRHAHSVTCCLSSLAQYAELRHDLDLLRRVQAFYNHGLWEMRDVIGWSPEQAQQTGSDHGEANNTGDILETALILGRHLDPRYDQDAERILRCHLLPSQLLDVSFVEEPDNPEGVDGLRDLARRHQGAWGFPAPYGHEPAGEGRGNLSFNMDIVGGVVGSLCAALQAAVRTDDDGHHVRLLMASETDGVQVRSPYGQHSTPEILVIRVLRRGALHIRLPPWVDPQRVIVEPVRERYTVDPAGLHITEPTLDSDIRIRFGLPVEEFPLTHHHDEPVWVRLRGDRVEAMDDRGTDLTFFPSFADLDLCVPD